MSSAWALRCITKVGRLSRSLYVSSASDSSVPLPKVKDETRDVLKTSESNPEKHTFEQAGLFYRVPESDTHIFQHGGLPRSVMEQCATFSETCLMIRKPAVEILSYLKAADYKNPPVKYVLYGEPGVGKSLVMAHILHYAFLSKWILIHVPWVGNWLRSPKNVANSHTRPGFVDLPENAVKWIIHFKTQNQALIKELDLRLTNEYEWSQREKSKVGDPLLDIIELGINRSRHSSEVMIALINEIKNHCRANKCKALLAVDGFNAFFHSNTRVKNEEKVMMPPEKISFIPSFMEATNADWHNSAAILTCDELVVPGWNASPLPLYQLGEKGFHHLDPFIPIAVPKMTEGEMRSTLAYYKERKWLQNTQGDDELVFLCGGNPYKLMTLCNPL